MIEQLHPKVYVAILGLVILFGSLFYMSIGSPIFKMEKDEHWQIHAVYVAEGYRPFKTEAVQLFLENSEGEPAESEQVRLELHSQSGNTERHWMHHLEDGLYQAELSFSESGDWDGVVTISKGKQQKEYPYTITVQPGAEKVEIDEIRK